MTSAKFFRFFESLGPTPLSATDLLYEIHATSLTTSALHDPPLLSNPDIISGGSLSLPIVYFKPNAAAAAAPRTGCPLNALLSASLHVVCPLPMVFVPQMKTGQPLKRPARPMGSSHELMLQSIRPMGSPVRLRCSYIFRLRDQSSAPLSCCRRRLPRTEIIFWIGTSCCTECPAII